MLRSIPASFIIVRTGLSEYIAPRLSRRVAAASAEFTTSIDLPRIVACTISPTIFISEHRSRGVSKETHTILLTPLREGEPWRLLGPVAHISQQR